MKTLVVGLGLIGGSVVRRLKGFRDTTIAGIKMAYGMMFISERRLLWILELRRNQM